MTQNRILLKAEALQAAIFNSVNFSSIATDEKGVIQIFNVGAERMLGYTAAEVIDKITPADISEPNEVIARAQALTLELGTHISAGFDALVFKASRGIEDIYELTYIRKDGTQFPAVVSVTALRDARECIIGFLLIGTDNTARKHAEEELLKAGALQRAIFNSENFSSIATDAKGVIQIFNVGAERMLGYTAAEVMNKITPADISDPLEVTARAQALSLELKTPITPGFEALVFKASRGIEDIYGLTYVRKDGSRFPAMVSVTALRDTRDSIIGYLLIGTDNTARKLAEEALLKAGALQRAIFNSENFSSIATDAKGVIQIFNVGAERMLGYTAAEVVNKITPASISDPHEVVARAQALTLELGTPITPGFEALVFKASRRIEDIYELTYVRKNGTRFPAVVSVTALRDARDEIIGYLLIGTDNSARRQVDDALRKSEAQLQTVIENIGEAVVVSDLDGRLLHFNPAALKMMGYASLDEGRRKFSELADTFELSGVDGTDWVVDQWPMARILKGEKLCDLEARMRRTGTEWDRIYSFNGTIARDPDGKPLMAIVTFNDITERKLAADEIRTLNLDLEKRVQQRTSQLQIANENLYVSQERYRSLVDGVKEYAIFTLDTFGCITTWNTGARRMKGFESDQIIGQHFSTFYTLEERRQCKPQSELKVALEVGQFEEDGWRVRKDGTRYWANVVITVLRDSHGIHTGFSKIVRDLSLRKLAEEKLRTSEEWLRSLVEGGKKYAIITMDTQGCVTTWNAGAQRIKGYRADDVLGQHISRFYTPEDVKRGKPEQELQAATETGQFEEDGWRVRKDGSRFWANVLISSLRDSSGKHLGFSKITRDLTDIMKAEEQARNFFRLSLELLCIAGVDGYFKLLNPAWESTLGYTQAELCSKPFCEFVHPDDLPATLAAVERISAFQPLGHFENRYRCKDGSYRWLWWKVTLSADSQLMHCAATDITQIKQTEGEIAGLNTSLQLQNLELATANKELEAFSYSVSHDLRAPLRSIDGFSKAILEDYTDKLDGTGKDYLQRVRSSSQRMGQLIDDMLNLSRVSRGDLVHEPTDLSQIAREVISECRASSKDRAVHVEIADGLITEADPRLMRIVLANLLGNAWKFTSKTEQASIEFGSTTENGNTEYFVRDNGAGFDMAYANKLFGAFQRLHTDKEFPGTGIGLATIQRVIHRHGGMVRAQSTLGEGATFYFTIKH